MEQNSLGLLFLNRYNLGFQTTVGGDPKKDLQSFQNLTGLCVFYYWHPCQPK